MPSTAGVLSVSHGTCHARKRPFGSTGAALNAVVIRAVMAVVPGYADAMGSL
jgi:hypothetical protein